MPAQTKRKTPRQLPASIYLGVREIRDRRLERLDAIAQRMGLGRSELIQEIADGAVEVARRRETV